MNRDTSSPPAANDQSDGAAGQQTPSTDMQPEDTGTANSGNSARGTAAEEAAKKTSKTEAGPGGKG